MNNKFIVIFIFFFSFSSLAFAQTTDVTQDVYKAKISSVYQIRVIDISTENKSSLGSGFQFTADGLIATNFHVAAQVIHEPTKYRIECVRSDNVIEPAEIVDLDIVHDLAVLRLKKAGKVFLKLSNEEVKNGEKIYSLGNPYDLGMTIVDGIFNGLMERSFYKRILFSGSLNSGMSGGPTLNREGEVIGVNVATRGNQISFLVPVEYLHKLYERILAQTQFLPQSKAYIAQQLVENQSQIVQALLDRKWQTLPMGGALVPAEMSSAFKCWGRSEPGPDKMFESTNLSCSSEDDLFVSDSLYTGRIAYHYRWLTSEKLNSFRFYSLYERLFAATEDFDNGGKRDVENFSCHSDFVKVSEKPVKLVLCTRQYKDYPQLFDMNLELALISEYQRGLLAQMVGFGLTQEKIQALTRKFLESIKWQK